MRVEILTLNFSIKDGLKIVSETKMKTKMSQKNDKERIIL